MKWLVLLPLLASLTASAPSNRQILDLQPPNGQLLFGAPIEDQPETKEIPSLTPDDFVSIQHSLKDAAVKAADAAHSLLSSVLDRHNLGDDAQEPAAAWPPHPPTFVDFSQYTILEILNASLSYKPESVSENDDQDSTWPWPKPPAEPKDLPFHKLGWIVNYSVEAQKELAKDGITLLAVDDIGLTPKHHARGPKKELAGDELADDMMDHPFFAKELQEDFVERQGVSAMDAESRRAHISKKIGYLIQYTTLPAPLTGWQIANHSTLPTSFPTGPDNAEPLRVRIEPSWTPHPIPHPTLAFNFYAYKRGFSIKAKNGIIHTISAPLFPPLSPLNKLFLFPQIFSTLTSGIQKIGLDDVLVATPIEDEIPPLVGDAHEVWNELMGDLKEKGGVNTVFAPTNFAFGRLGPKILALLHTPLPLSKTILKYVLSYHIIPDIVFHTDYVLNTTSLEPVAPLATETDIDVHSSWILDDYEVTESHSSFAPRWEIPKFPLPKKPEEPSHPPPPHKPHPHHKANVTHYALPTLLVTSGVQPNGTAHVLVVSYRKFGKGPVRRALIVLPAEGHHHKKGGRKELKELMSEPMEVEDGYEEDFHHGHHKEGAKPVKVWKADVVSRKGAIHVVTSLLRPPVYHHKTEESGEVFEKRVEKKGGCKHKQMKRKFEGLFA